MAWQVLQEAILGFASSGRFSWPKTGMKAPVHVAQNDAKWCAEYREGYSGAAAVLMENGKHYIHTYVYIYIYLYMFLEAMSCWLGVPLFLEVLVFREQKRGWPCTSTLQSEVWAMQHTDLFQKGAATLFCALSPACYGKPSNAVLKGKRGVA